MSKPWSKIGAWAADSEAAEAEELAAAAAEAFPPASTAEAFPPASAAFPSLRESASAPKHKKKTKMSLQEFNAAASAAAGISPEGMLRLPTGPKERSRDEILSGGRGFSSYGRRDEGESGGRRPYGGGFDNEERRPVGPARVSEFDSNLPSRADEADNWAMGKKNLPNINKYTSLGTGPGGSRADDVDNWGSGKRDPPDTTRLTPGSGRPRMVFAPPKKEVLAGPTKSNKPSPFGAARPREEVLAEKGLDWKKMEMEIEARKTSSRPTSRPTSSYSSRPTSSHSNRSEGVGVARVKVNPFGDAKPREVLLEEKGLDWRKIDLDLDRRRVERPETEAEKILKEEIDALKKKLSEQSASNATTEPHERSAEDLHDIIKNKETDLELLIRELDDKVRFPPRVNERPGSGSGRVSGPHSRSKSFDENRNIEFMERPRSRGTVDMWSRQTDDRRGFQGGIDRGFVGNRGMDRPRSRGRW